MNDSSVFAPIEDAVMHGDEDGEVVLIGFPQLGVDPDSLKGIVLDEPSVVAIRRGRDSNNPKAIAAVGVEAKRVLEDKSATADERSSGAS